MRLCIFYTLSHLSAILCNSNAYIPLLHYNLGDKIIKKVTVSIPEEMLDDMNEEIKDKKFSSLSEFIRYVIREHFERKEK